MISVQGRNHPRQERYSVTLLNSSLSPKSEFSEQSIESSGTNLPLLLSLLLLLISSNIPKMTCNRFLKLFWRLKLPLPLLLLLSSQFPLFPKSPRISHERPISWIFIAKSLIWTTITSCHQCEDYFATARATGANQIPFTTSFLRDRISFCWQQYKRRWDVDSFVPVTWDKFKAFLRQSLGDSQVFVEIYWGKITRDSQYQLEEVFDWAAHLKHLQMVF